MYSFFFLNYCKTKMYYIRLILTVIKICTIMIYSIIVD